MTHTNNDTHNKVQTNINRHTQEQTNINKHKIDNINKRDDTFAQAQIRTIL